MAIQPKKEKNRKGQFIVIGSFLMVVGIALLIFPYFKEKKIKAFETMNLQLAQVENQDDDEIPDAPEVENLPTGEMTSQPQITIPYIGTLEIPKIKLKRGFVSKDSYYNNINYAVTTLPSSTYPDVEKGNFILVAHSGTAAISFFRYLYKLEIGDLAYVEYNNIRYQYRLKNIYYEEKTGTIALRRDYNKTTMTLITCTYQDDTKQTVYVFELETQIPVN